MTKKRRYLISAAVLVAGVCIALGVLAMLPPSPGVTKANFDRIEEGMTRADVEHVFGGKGQPFHADNEITYWWSEDQPRKQAWIRFTDEFVAKKNWMAPAESETVFDKIRRWLHLPK